MLTPLNGTLVPLSNDSPTRSPLGAPTPTKYLIMPTSWFGPPRLPQTPKRLDSSRISSVSLHHFGANDWSVTFIRGQDYCRTYVLKQKNSFRLRVMLKKVVTRLAFQQHAIIEPEHDGWFCYLTSKSSVYPLPATSGQGV